MPIVLLVIGIIILVAAIRGKDEVDKLIDILKDDFASENNFLIWGLAFFIIGAVGYYPPLRPLSRSFMVLVILGLFLSNEGFFNKFMAQIRA
jgi:hypothetical protein